MALPYLNATSTGLLFLAILLSANVALSEGVPRKLAQAAPSTGARTFMASLPLRISITTPTELATGGTAFMSSLQAITVVFSRPVIALGSDFENDGAVKQATPFRLSCNWPGKFRWVTTSIIRYDPDKAWPTDLKCDVVWNRGLKTWDGVPLQLGDISNTSRLRSSSLDLWYYSIYSEMANNITEGNWNSGALMSDDKSPELPPDGHVQLYFSYEVNLLAVAQALQFLEGNSRYGIVTVPTTKVDLKVRPCTSPPSRLEDVSLNISSTCVDVQVGSSLMPDTWYTLRLPTGTKYNSVSASLSRDIDAPVAGLRRFRIPFKDDIPKDDSVRLFDSLRRWDMFLPHSLSPNTTAGSLASVIRVCEVGLPSPTLPAPCSNVTFNLTLVSRTVARLQVPGAQPAKAYRIYVSGNPAIRNGFGRPLEDSSIQIGMEYVQPKFAQPGFSSSWFAVLETDGVDNLTHWPYVTHAPPPDMYGTAFPDRPINISTYRINAENVSDIIGVIDLASRLTDFDYRKVNLDAQFGIPTSVTTVNRNLTTPGSGADWTMVSAPMASTPIQLFYACCHQETPWYTRSFPAVVVRTNVSLSVVQSGQYMVAWVTDSAQGGAGPVAGAEVFFYSKAFSWYNTDAIPLTEGSCVTNADGYCTIQLRFSNDNDVVFAVARLISETGVVRTAVLPTAGYLIGKPTVQPYKASTILDRKVLEPGDSLKITGFVQEASLNGLSPPTNTYVLGVVSPDFTPNDGAGNRISFIEKVNNITSSFHAELVVPANAVMKEYNINFYVLSSTGTKKPNIADKSILRASQYLLEADQMFTVSSPRAPTAELKLANDPWVTPNGTVSLNVTAISYIGASVGNSTITVTWSVTSFSDANGIIKLTTNGDGVAAGTIDLAPASAAAVAKELTLSGFVRIDVEWIGPTRERITQAASVKIATGPAEISLQTSIQTNIPGIPFTVAAILTSSADGSILLDVPVNATLQPTSAGATTCNATSTCSILSSRNWMTGSKSCRMALPCAGVFVLEVCADVPYNSGTTRVCSRSSIGRTTAEWAASPLATRVEPYLNIDKPTGYRMGEAPRFMFENPYSGARLLVVWGTIYSVKAKVFTGIPGGAVFNATIDPLGSECRFNCLLTAVLDVPRVGPTDMPLLPPKSELPVSALFDPRSPHSFVMSTPINILPDNELSVSVAVAPAPAAAGAAAGVASTVKDSGGSVLPVVQPGATAQITVQVGSTAADGPVEVTVYAIEKAFLDLLPYNIPQPHLQMLLTLSSYMSSYNMAQYRIAPGAIWAVYYKLLARLKLDPWLPVDTTVVPGYTTLPPVDQSDDDFLAAHANMITLGYGWDVMMMGSAEQGPAHMSMMRPPAALMPGNAVGEVSVSDVARGQDGSDNGSGTSALVSPDMIRKAGQFVVTPLFSYSLTNSNGQASFNFTAPPNLGSFVIRAFAAAGSSAKYGSAESKLVVRRSLSLTPSVPRFVRVGDTFEAGVVVTVGSAPANVTVSLQVSNPAKSSIRAVGASTRIVTFTSGGDLEREVRFNFTARAMGTTTLLIGARDSTPGGGSDLLEVKIDVEGQQGDVWLATSFAITSNSSISATANNNSNSSSGWVEGITLPGAVPGSGGLTLTAGVGYLPSVVAVYDNLLVTEEWRTDPYAQPAVLWVTLPAVLSYYGQSTTAKQNTEVSQAVEDLTVLTSTFYGLRWMLPSKWNGWTQNRVDVDLNIWALFMAKFHSSGTTNSSGPLSEVVNSLVPLWESALDRQLVLDVSEARAYSYNYSDWNTLAWIRFVRGARWSPAANSSADTYTLRMLSLNRTLTALRDPNTTWAFSRETRILLSLVVLSMGRSNPDPRLVNETVTELTGSIRIQGRTAYVSWGAGSPSAASLEQQALALLLFIRSGTRNQLIPKLAAYVANGLSSSGAGGFYYYYSPLHVQGLAVAALTEYDVSRGSSKPTLNLDAEVNGLNVLKASFRPNRTSPVTSSTAWEKIRAPPRGKASELDFQVSGTGEVTIAASLHFVPSVLPSFPAYRGISVDLAIQLVDQLSGTATGPRVSAVPLGSVVMVSVQLSTPDDLGAVTLSVMMPGGLEPLDPNLVSDAGSSCIYDILGSSGLMSFYPRWWWWPICPARETRPSLVTFSYAALRSGTTYVTIKAVAATVGTFVVPPVRVSVDDQPELMGMTAGGSFQICAGCTAATPAEPPRVPTPCPEDCSNNGVCNLRRGVCLCDDAYTGADCATLALK